jgi:fatty acid desaturase
LHETVHRTAFRTPWINKAVGDVCGFLLLLPPRWFAAFHFAHHRFTQDPERDPELASAKPTTFARYLYLLTGIEYWYRMVQGLFGRAFGHTPGAFLDDRSRRRSIVEARVYLGLYAVVAVASALIDPRPVLVLWVGPALLGQPFLRAYLLSEHWGCPAVRDMWANTRSVVSIAPIRWLAWNMPYHAEHHANPGIPFHALPTYAAAIAGARKVEASGYAAFHGERIGALREGTAEPV